MGNQDYVVILFFFSNRIFSTGIIVIHRLIFLVLSGFFHRQVHFQVLEYEFVIFQVFQDAWEPCIHRLFHPIKSQQDYRPRINYTLIQNIFHSRRFVYQADIGSEGSSTKCASHLLRCYTLRSLHELFCTGLLLCGLDLATRWS